jgi:transposase
VPLPDTCSCGGHDLVETDIVHQYQTEIPVEPIHRQFDIHVGRCQTCGKRVQGRHELQTSDALGAAASQIGPDAQAGIVSLNKEMGLSHGKIEKVLDTLFGIDLSRGGSVHTVLRAASRCQPLYEDIQNEIRTSDVLWPDETGWRVGGQSSWLHVWVSESATCYHIDPHRSADALEAVIGLDWDGWLHHDGYATYNRFGKATHQQCVAHILHRARDMLIGAKGGAVHFPRQVIGLFTEAIVLRQRYQRGEVSLTTMAAARIEFENRLLGLLLPRRVNPDSTRLSNHLWNHIDEWFTFLSDPQAETTNNRAERAIRPAVVNRKVWGGNRTWVGAKAQSILLSVLRTCHQRSLQTVDFLSQLFRGRAMPLVAPAAV